MQTLKRCASPLLASFLSCCAVTLKQRSKLRMRLPGAQQCHSLQVPLPQSKRLRPNGKTIAQVGPDLPHEGVELTVGQGGFEGFGAHGFRGTPTCGGVRWVALV